MENQWREFLAEYPLEADTRETWNEWREIPAPIREKVLEGLRRWKTSDEWREDGGRFIPTAANFLRKEIWKTRPRNYRAAFNPEGPARVLTQEEMFERHHIHSADAFHMWKRAQEIGRNAKTKRHGKKESK